ncbi:nucleolar complex protein 3 homolog isoform X1 [Metopolophium dirhodum]|uniref:nucleolar complex protein 3 homolog isoform X1 n=2 Tax=Metopolophium dirhodum TaxID=44670 RepID=UPI00298FD909|nr:nucleolar complex protein 3 homolog isoform X1 [Metopolophium dirhodum]
MVKKNMVKTRGKTSSVKRRNHLRNKGHIKTKKHKSKAYNVPQPPLKRRDDPPEEIEEEEAENSDIGDDMLEMVDQEDLDFLKKNISNQNYKLYNRIQITNDGKNKRTRENDDEELENEYESSSMMMKADDVSIKKPLLPIKTKDGILRRYTLEKDEIEIEKSQPKKKIIEDNKENNDEYVWLDAIEPKKEISVNKGEPISVAKLYAKRENTIQNYKQRIGLLASTLLENPDLKIGNIVHLLEIMEKRDPELQVVIKKLATLTLLEVFKDLLPSYQLKLDKHDGVKLKLVTKELIGYEGQLLKGYKIYLTNLEKMASCLHKKKGDTRVITNVHINLAEMAVNCMCELLISHSYFNYAVNIGHLLTLYLDNKNTNVRKKVEETFIKIFKEDKKGTISLVIVRRINQLVKTRSHCVHSELLSVLLALPIRNVNLDKEKEDILKSKKFMTRKQKLLAMSKKERKRSKMLDKLDKEMLETKAEENVKSHLNNLTEITKLVFLIYFRILKTAPRSKLLSVCLEGLAKYSHSINLEFYHDILTVLDSVIKKHQLNVHEQLCCIKTIFVILSGQGTVINIDPVHFYSHLYRVIPELDCCKYHDNLETFLRTIEALFLVGRKKVTANSTLSFVKRMSTLSLQTLHNASLGILAALRTIIQTNKNTESLLDVDPSYGQGIYNAELQEPEHSNAGSTSLWELPALQRHYHPEVCRLSKTVASLTVSQNNYNNLKPELAKMTPSEWFKEYDPSNVAFNPAVMPPVKVPQRIPAHYPTLPYSDVLDKKFPNVDFSKDFF